MKVESESRESFWGVMRARERGKAKHKIVHLFF